MLSITKAAWAGVYLRSCSLWSSGTIFTIVFASDDARTLKRTQGLGIRCAEKGRACLDIFTTVMNKCKTPPPGLHVGTLEGDVLDGWAIDRRGMRCYEKHTRIAMKRIVGNALAFTRRYYATPHTFNNATLRNILHVVL